MIAMKSCSSCGEERPREAFSAKQWKAKAHGRRCASCVDGAAAPRPAREAQGARRECEARAAPAAAEAPFCTICLDALGEEPSETLRCGHAFHVACLARRRKLAPEDSWFCPNCRRPTGERDPDAAWNDVHAVAGETEVHRVASRRGTGRTLAQCVADGDDVDAQRADGATPLFLAVAFGHFEEVRELLRLRADPKIVAWGWGWPPDWDWPDEPEISRDLRGIAAMSPMAMACLSHDKVAPNKVVAAVYINGGLQAHVGQGPVFDHLEMLAIAYMESHPSLEPLSEALRRVRADDSTAVAELSRRAVDLLGFDPFRVHACSRDRGDDDDFPDALRARVEARHPGFDGSDEDARECEFLHMLRTDPAQTALAFHSTGHVGRKEWTMMESVHAMAKFLTDPDVPRQSVHAARDRAATLMCGLERRGPGVAAEREALSHRGHFLAMLGSWRTKTAEDVLQGVYGYLQARETGAAKRSRRRPLPLSDEKRAELLATLDEAPADEAHAERNICAMLKALDSSEEGKEMTGGLKRLLERKVAAKEQIDPSELAEECTVS